MKNRLSNAITQLCLILIFMLKVSTAYEFTNFSLENSNTIENSEIRLKLTNANSNSNFKTKTDYYPAFNVVKSNDFWQSEGTHKEEEVIIFEGLLEYTARIFTLIIEWQSAPGLFKIEFMSDGNKYKTVVKWIDPYVVIKKTFFKKIKSFPLKINFYDTIFASKIKISMKRPVNFYYGIKIIKVYSKETINLIKIFDKNECLEKCLVVTQKYIENSPVEFFDCIDAISLSRNMELFRVKANGQILHLVSNLCVKENEFGFVVLGDCLNHTNAVNLYYKHDKTIGKINDGDNGCLVSDARTSKINLIEESILYVNNGRPVKYSDFFNNGYWEDRKLLLINNIIIKIKFDAPSLIKHIFIKWRNIQRIFTLSILNTEKELIKVFSIKNNKNRNTEVYLDNYIYVIEVHLHLENENNFMSSIEDIIITNGTERTIIDDCKLPQSILFKNFELIEQNLILKTFTISNEESNFLNLKHNYLEEASISLTHIQRIFRNIENLNIQMSRMIKEFKSELIKSGKIKELQENLFSIYNITEINIQKYQNDLMKPTYSALDIKNTNHPYKKGYSFQSPLSSCHAIQIYYISVLSGFYWIKPECSSKAIRVFCDFILGKTIYISNRNMKLNLKDRSLPEMVKNECERIGLHPIEINSKLILKRVSQLIESRKIKVTGNKLIPLGYDYHCEENNFGCINRYNSINSKIQLNEYLQEYLRENTDLSNTSTINDSVGFIQKGNKLEIEFFNYKNPPKDLLYIDFICSNKNENHNKPQVFSIQCEDNLNSHEKLQKISSSVKVTVECPSNCIAKSNSNKVIGDVIYSGASSICLSAVHSGVTDRKFVLKFEGSHNKFNSSFRNKIQSISSFNLISMRSFSIEKYFHKCNNINRGQKSNIIVSNMSDNNDKGVLNIVNPRIFRLKQIYLDEIYDNGSVLVINKHFNNNEIYNSKVNKICVNQCSYTEEGIYKIKKTRNKEYENLFIFDKYMKNKFLTNLDIIKRQTEQFQKMNNLSKINFGLEKLKLNVTEKKKLIEKLNTESIRKLNLFNKISKKAKISYESLEKFDYFKLDFKKKLSDQFYIDEFPKVHSSSKWVSTENKLLQLSNIKKNRLSSSNLIIKNRYYYDIDIKVSLLVNSNSSGIMFRYKDEFNYYSLEVKNYKSNLILKLYSNYIGKSKLLSRHISNSPDQIVDLIIKNESNNISIYYKDCLLPIIFVSNDLFSSGSVGLFVNNNDKFLLSKMEITPLKCSSSFNSVVNYNIINTHTSNMYREDFNSDLKLKYDANFGNYNWSISRSIKNRELKALKSSLEEFKNYKITNKTLEYEVPSCMLVKDIYFNHGEINLKLLTYFDNTDGFFSIFFKYINEKNYFRFDISNSFFSFKHIENGDLKIIKLIKFESLPYDFSAYTTYKVKILVNDNIDIFYSKEPFHKLYKIISTENKLNQSGLVGFGVMHKFIEISEFTISPPKFSDKKYKWENSLIYI